jgi:hypothetical protein
MPNLIRHETGRKAFAAFFDSWIEFSTLSAFDWQQLSEDALGVPKLHLEQISGLRTGASKHLGVKVIDAIAAVNLATYRFHFGDKPNLSGPNALRIECVQPLINKDGDMPCSAGDFVNIYLGLEEPPALDSDWASKKRSARESELVEQFACLPVNEKERALALLGA